MESGFSSNAVIRVPEKKQTFFFFDGGTASQGRSSRLLEDFSWSIYLCGRVVSVASVAGGSIIYSTWPAHSLT